MLTGNIAPIYSDTIQYMDLARNEGLWGSAPNINVNGVTTIVDRTEVGQLDRTESASTSATVHLEAPTRKRSESSLWEYWSCVSYFLREFLV
jgi:hypothetical protein